MRGLRNLQISFINVQRRQQPCKPLRFIGIGRRESIPYLIIASSIDNLIIQAFSLAINNLLQISTDPLHQLDIQPITTRSKHDPTMSVFKIIPPPLLSNDSTSSIPLQTHPSRPTLQLNPSSMRTYHSESKKMMQSKLKRNLI
jgi:hypothetical protein